MTGAICTRSLVQSAPLQCTVVIMMDDPTNSDALEHAAAILRARARRVDNARQALIAAIVEAYQEGSSVRSIGRAVGRSHRWVIAVLTEQGVYEEGAK